jgi:hypothetical protein
MLLVVFLISLALEDALDLLSGSLQSRNDLLVRKRALASSRPRITTEALLIFDIDRCHGLECSTEQRRLEVRHSSATVLRMPMMPTIQIHYRCGICGYEEIEEGSIPTYKDCPQCGDGGGARVPRGSDDPDQSGGIAKEVEREENLQLVGIH